MTVGDLINKLSVVDPSLEVILRVDTDGDGTLAIGGVTSVEVEEGCTETPALMIDGSVEVTE